MLQSVIHVWLTFSMGRKCYQHSFKIPGRFGHLSMLLALTAKITGYSLARSLN